MPRLIGACEGGDTWQMEQLSRAYVKAVASVAGCQVDWSDVDYDSVDGTFRRRSIGAINRAPILDFQLKCTAQDLLRADGVHFPFSLKNYDDLRAVNLSAPRIAVVVLIPPDVQHWLRHTEDELLIRRCGYWVSLRGEPAVTNGNTKTVIVPRTNVFDANQLDSMFLRIESGHLP